MICFGGIAECALEVEICMRATSFDRSPTRFCGDRLEELRGRVRPPRCDNVWRGKSCEVLCLQAYLVVRNLVAVYVSVVA